MSKSVYVPPIQLFLAVTILSLAHGLALAQGTEFILIERWENIELRMDFTMNRSKERDEDLFAYLLPQHSAEYYEEVTG